MDSTLQKSKSIVITGAESSGKTTLARDLSMAMGYILVEEQSRDYLNNLNRPYQQSDLARISELQFNAINKALAKGHEVSDTDLLTQKIWGLEKYNKVDEFTEKHYPTQLPDLYIVCSPDIPWEPDPLRENPHDRDRLFKRYLEEIEALKVPFTIVRGSESERLNQALVFIRKII